MVANERIINSSGRMALRFGCLYSEIGSQMWRHNRAVEWTDLGFVGFCCERQFSVSNEGSKHLRQILLAIKEPQNESKRLAFIGNWETQNSLDASISIQAYRGTSVAPICKAKQNMKSLLIVCKLGLLDGS
ncbi:unnamed protein product [Citrullus colocynthis]|uniref:Uncharacterized protein n=1 Tax=Citrullus colocynthis TaxID=252529 RepID=A0ABP0YA78_9ROSI